MHLLIFAPYERICCLPGGQVDYAGHVTTLDSTNAVQQKAQSLPHHFAYTNFECVPCDALHCAAVACSLQHAVPYALKLPYPSQQTTMLHNAALPVLDCNVLRAGCCMPADLARWWCVTYIKFCLFDRRL
eukprot:TRINITY_DN4918_c0_g3_i2.p1 TRINITY_DN4918_c0_g3~~TRINITY_DN4918_c0_g3_i2.p1  ORF type:complete len:130 (-),score=0.10 TRINITY_DN4918_c0_g3_i2:293-682(-)